jgi:methylated-DNA-[protein]-cysteine S-methyltransferase
MPCTHGGPDSIHMPARAFIATPFDQPLLISAGHAHIVGCSFQPKGREAATRSSNRLLVEALRQLDAYFRGRLRRFDLPLALEGTPFQIAVWSFASGLQVGELISYGDLARAIGHPRAHRGVAAAMARTPFDLLIPAHRVIGSDGTVRGASASAMRRRLLAFEGVVLA